MRRVLTAVTLAAAAVGLGSANTAQAAVLPKLSELGTLAAVDPGNLGETVDGVAQKSTSVVGETGGNALRRAVPTAGRTGGTAVRKTGGAVRRAAGDTVGSAREILGETARSAALDQPVGGLPVKGLPTGGQLPVRGVPGVN
ncbi:ATP-binding protein [Streptomyces orinoci]|uniref:ATP-binding protein n=1 Tax=Streptomyces orinoci TaxID=67339 RepID=A0ABV3K0E2_STRON|nr:ATP-binding protein [Streptomyces orinoci]